MDILRTMAFDKDKSINQLQVGEISLLIYPGYLRT